MGKMKQKKCITEENFIKIKTNIEHYTNYIKSLKIIDKKNNIPIPILRSKRKIGFWGFIVGMNSALHLAKYLFEKKLITYLLTYKMSQDHIETFFANIRAMGGFNNNPTCLQFKRAFKKLMTHVHALVSKEANCTTQDETDILKPEMETNTNELLHDVFTSFDHDYESSNSWCWNEYSSEVVTYIAGAVVKKIKDKIKCDICRQNLEEHRFFINTNKK